MRAATTQTNPTQQRRFRAVAAAVALVAIPLAAAALTNRSAGAAMSSVHGTVYADDDHGGTKNGAEAGIAGVTVTAYIPDGFGGETPIGSDTTGANGSYAIGTVDETLNVRLTFSGAAVVPVALGRRNHFFAPGADHLADLGV